MIKYYIILSSILFCTNITASAQDFVNGSFEIATDSCLDNIPHGNVHNIIPGVYSFGTSQGLDFKANSCPYQPSLQPASARHGSKYLSFGYDGTGGDSFALALTAPLSAGTTYRLSYSHRRERGTAAPSPGYGRSSPFHDIGYSDDSTKFGNLITHGHCLNGYYDNVFSWGDTFYQFTPSINARFITFKSTANGEILYLDNFSISTAAGINSIKAKELRCYPNPFNDYTIIQTDKIAFPFDLQVTDLAGKVWHTLKNISRKEVRVDRRDLPAGIYILQLRDKDMMVFNSKITVL